MTFFLAAGSADASTLRVEDGIVVFAAAEGEDNHVNVYAAPDGRVSVGDKEPMTVGDGCTAQDGGGVCSGDLRGVRVSLGDGDDVGSILEYAGGPDLDLVLRGDAGRDLVWGLAADGATVEGGAGGDHVIGSEGPDHLDGGEGYDSLLGYAGDDVLIGGPDDSGDALEGHHGNDRLEGGGGGDRLDGDFPRIYGDQPEGGADVLIGGEGDDQLEGGRGADDMDGGPGYDWLTYDMRASAVHIDLEGDADDGMAGEGDRIHAGIESLTGGDGDDTIAGDETHNALYGGEGDDELTGRGDDDSLEGGGDDDRLDGGADDDRLVAGEGADHVVGGAGADRMEGEEGADVVDARDGGYDGQVDCGTGVDAALTDESEASSRCETVNGAPGSRPSQQPPPGSGGWTPAQAVAAAGRNWLPSYHDGLVMTSSGDAIAQWLEHPPGAGVHLRAWRAGSPTPDPPVVLAEHGSPRGVAVDGAGRALVAWGENGGRQFARMRAADGTLGPVEPIAIADTYRFDIVMSRDGDAAAVWKGDKRIMAAFRADDGTWGDPVAVTPELTRRVEALDAALSDAGDLTVVWEGDYIHILAGGRTAAGVLLPEQEITDRGMRPRVETDAAGNATMLWNGLNTQPGYAQRAVGAAAFGPRTELGEVNRDADLGVADDGEVTVAWAVGTGVHVASGAFGGPLQDAGGFTSDSGAPHVAVSPGGDALVAWPAGPKGHYVSVRRGAGEERFSRMEDVRPACERASGAVFAIADGGRSAAFLIREDKAFMAIGTPLTAPGHQECAPDTTYDGPSEGPGHEEPDDGGDGGDGDEGNEGTDDGTGEDKTGGDDTTGKDPTTGGDRPATDADPVRGATPPPDRVPTGPAPEPLRPPALPRAAEPSIPRVAGLSVERRRGIAWSVSCAPVCRVTATVTVRDRRGRVIARKRMVRAVTGTRRLRMRLARGVRARGREFTLRIVTVDPAGRRRTTVLRANG